MLLSKPPYPTGALEPHALVWLDVEVLLFADNDQANGDADHQLQQCAPPLVHHRNAEVRDFHRLTRKYMHRGTGTVEGNPTREAAGH